MSGPLTGKVAFVAGASRGIGATVAAALAREGAAVAVAARSEQEGKLPGTIHAVADRITTAGQAVELWRHWAASCRIVRSCSGRWPASSTGTKSALLPQKIYRRKRIFRSDDAVRSEGAS